MAANRLPGFACRIRAKFVVSRDQDNVSSILKTNLSRAQNVPRRVKADFNAPHDKRFTVGQKLELSIGTHSQPQHMFTRLCCKVLLAAPASMIRVRMRNHSASDRKPGVDVEVAAGAIQTSRRLLQDYFQNSAFCFNFPMSWLLPDGVCISLWKARLSSLDSDPSPAPHGQHVQPWCKNTQTQGRKNQT